MEEIKAWLSYIRAHRWTWTRTSPGEGSKCFRCKGSSGAAYKNNSKGIWASFRRSDYNTHSPACHRSKTRWKTQDGSTRYPRYKSSCWMSNAHVWVSNDARMSPYEACLLRRWGCNNSPWYKTSTFDDCWAWTCLRTLKTHSFSNYDDLWGWYRSNTMKSVCL